MRFILIISLIYCSVGCNKAFVFRNDLQNQTRIVGGFEAEKYSRPFQVSLQTENGNHFCGGTIINQWHVLTVAHCCTGRRFIKVVAGDHDLTQPEGHEQERTVDLMIIHKDYLYNKEKGQVYNDICMLRLNYPFMMKKRVNNFRLPSKNQEFRLDAIISGWGKLSENGPISNTLQQSFAEIIPDSRCRLLYGDFRITNNESPIILSSMICAMGEESVPCNGDSGGPMTCFDDFKREFLCGIASFVMSCNQLGSPAVFTEISKFLPWISNALSYSEQLELVILVNKQKLLSFYQ